MDDVNLLNLRNVNVWNPFQGDCSGAEETAQGVPWWCGGFGALNAAAWFDSQSGNHQKQKQ